MTLRHYLVILALGSALAWAAWIIVLLFLHPTAGGGMAILAFLGTLVFALTGTLTILGTLVRMGRYGDTGFDLAVARSVRQGFWLALLVAGSLLLAARGMLSLGAVILLILGVALLEVVFLARDDRHTHRG